MKQLAVELALRFNGEIINADAMQMYTGLPIITNKISQEERRGIRHHLLGNIGLHHETWTVGVFKREASKIIREIRSRGRLPIVVGGTHYYTNGLLFEDSLVDESPSRPPDEDGKPLQDSGLEYPILNGPTEEMIKKLREVDPVMAERWHPNDRRKIRRSLEIFLTTGKRASDIYAEQQRRKEFKWNSPEPRGPRGSWQSLLLWVYSQPETLKERLDNRVDKMLANGLLNETAEMYRFLQARLNAGEEVDRTKGIWQSIGFKEFEPYLRGEADGGLGPDELEKLKQAGAEDTKTATRHYAKYQVKWITKKTLPLIRQEKALDSLYLLDSTDGNRWSEEVLAKGTDLTRLFLGGDPLPSPIGISPVAKEVLSEKIEMSSQQEAPCQKRCELCGVTLMTEGKWEKHVKGNRHRRATRHAKRTALTPFGLRPTNLTNIE